MFDSIPPEMIKVMRELERLDSEDHSISKQVPPHVGRLLAILAASSGGGTWLELGTSCGYSAMWLSLACRARGARLTTVDRDPAKVRVARENLRRAGADDVVRVVEGDSIGELQRHEHLDFCFIDAGGGAGTYDIVVPRTRPGGLIIYDHTKGRGAEIVEAALKDPRVDAVLLNVAAERRRTELICRRC